jgi:hypothetical protein
MALTAGVALLAALQIAAPTQLPHTPVTLRVGPQRPDLVRYNRVEALSLGVRGQVRPETPWGPLSLTGTVRLGIGDLHPNGALDVVHESVRDRVVVSGYHELTSIDERARDFGLANTLMALLAGQDLGDYYRRSGARVEWTPPTADPRTFRLRAFAEYQEGVEKETDVQLPRLWDEDRRFRANIAADDGWELGGSLELARRWGRDPGRTRGGAAATVLAATGDRDFVRNSLGADLTLALPRRFSVTLEAEGGTSWGTPSVQRLWYVGGPLTLRGFEPRAAGGQSFTRARAELDRAFSFGRVVVFSDMGWVGERGDLDLDAALWSAGVGLAVVDGILRIDGACPLDDPRGFRVDVYLDQIL